MLNKRHHGPSPPPDILSAFGLPSSASTNPLEGGQSTSYLASSHVLKRHPANELPLAAFALAILAALPQSSSYRFPRPVHAVMSGELLVDAWACAPFVAHVSPLDPARRPMTLQRYRRILRPARAFHAALAALPNPTMRSGASWSTLAQAIAEGRTDRWAVAERVAFGEVHWRGLGLHVQGEMLVRRLFDLLEEVLCARSKGIAGAIGRCGVGQLVHGDLAGNVLFPDDENDCDAGTEDGTGEEGSLVIIDFSPYWRPVSFAEGMLAVDGVLRFGAGEDVLVEAADEGSAGVEMLIRALIFRAVSCSVRGPVGEELQDFEGVMEMVRRRVKCFVGSMSS